MEQFGGAAPSVCNHLLHMRDSLRGRRTALCVAVGAGLAAVVVVMIAGKGTSATRSEGSGQVAYAAPLGFAHTVVLSRALHQGRYRGAQHVGQGCWRSSWAPSASRSYVAVVRHLAVARSRPGGTIIGRFGRFDQNDYPTVFAILAARGDPCHPAWYRVQLPVPPNGSTGWIRSWSVRTVQVHARMVVRLALRRLLVYRSGKRIFSAYIAVGAAETPTPTGEFFVNERFLLRSHDGPFGVAALGISAHSTVLHNWVQGGPIALHGTNDPSSIGHAVSHGCIRLNNTEMRRLLTLAPAGTPVVIRP